MQMVNRYVIACVGQPFWPVAELHPEPASRKTPLDDPSPERIRELTAEIRSRWTPEERRQRAGMFHCVELLEMRLQSRRRGFLGEWTN